VAAIDDLITQIEDSALRERLSEEVERLTKKKKFGLVFEEHLPELTPIYSAPIRRGSRVTRRGNPLTDVWGVLNSSSGMATCFNLATGECRDMEEDDLVVVRRFGEAIFPALSRIDRVANGPQDSPWHTLIEADNYHALQLLQYIYAGQVDCIYIDPPYNTGARDWKYNNDYVDSNDRWRHSKWLAMMRRRLVIARQLLRLDGVLIVTIDDNEAHHLRCLLSDLFPGHKVFTVVIEHNKRGRQGEEFAKTHEYAYFVVPEAEGAISEEPTDGPIGGGTRNLRRTGNNSLRSARPNQFYPIWINPETLEIVEVGQSIPLESPRTDSPKSGMMPIWPIDKKGVERNWHYASARTVDELASGNIYAQEQAYGPQIYFTLRSKTSKRYKTVWSKPSLDASTHGSELVRDILGGVSDFSFPKSLYAEMDCIAAVCRDREDALILDFFAGSGTTLHAVNALNAQDNGRRRCVLVTNNEVSEKEAKVLAELGHHPGDAEWEQQGVCRSVTWPRSKYTILGNRDDGSELEGDYLFGKAITKEKSRTFRRLGFIDANALTTAARKKELVSIIEGIPASRIKANSAFFVSADESHNASILFDDTEIEAYLETISGMNHITDFYIITGSDKLFKKVKAQIQEMLPSIEEQAVSRRPMSQGFPANLEYFRLDFLDKDEVALHRQFRELLPILWLRAGAVGARPELEPDEPIPAMMVPERNSFAVLVDETRFPDFQAALKPRQDITYAFIVTNSEEAYQEMASQLMIPNVIQLYRDYLENFAINGAELT